MTPEFASAALPLVVTVLDLCNRATAATTSSAESERAVLKAQFEATAAKLRGPRAEEWGLASYALASLVDELLIVDIPWTGQSWWENHAFEVDLFSTRRRATEFYAKADKAASYPSQDSMAIFVLAVLAGFRGVLRDQPDQLEAWVRSHIQSIRFGQPATALPVDGPDMPGAPPLDGTLTLLWQGLAAIALASILSVVCWWAFWLV